MCITALFMQRTGRWRFVLIGNRDEFQTRKTEAIEEKRGLLCARDVKAGGAQTMLNIKDGILSTLTNVRTQPGKGGERSRGKVVEDAVLQDPEMLEELARTRSQYAGFNLLRIDLKKNIAKYVTNNISWEGDSVYDLPMGSHCMSNSYLNDFSWEKVDYLKKTLENIVTSSPADGSVDSFMTSITEPLCHSSGFVSYPTSLNNPEYNPYAKVEAQLQQGIWVSVPTGNDIFRTLFQTAVAVEDSGDGLLCHYWYRDTQTPESHGEWVKFTFPL
eukprot:TRINITY_DN34239_c0_g1_i1.p1 TRINITY_DN34239_c0_g1~~TRINITY_DN34239_c0_g1_i1.p1  ORF type:complete len:273 (+),score=54.58 TRINITY_DN34239_c0_g1_i1:43-861(+)